MKILQKIGFALGVASFCATNLAQAATSTGNLAVSAVVSTSCSIQSAALPFGNYNFSAIQRSAQLGVNCSSGTSYTVSFDAGATPGASVVDRKLASGDANATLSYALYQDPARSKNWGNTSDSTLTNVGTGSQQNLPVYGYIPSGQTAKAGSYNDIVGVTLSY